MKSSSWAWVCGMVVLLVAICGSAFAGGPEKRPLGEYSLLWSGSLLTITPVKMGEGEAEANDPGGEKAAPSPAGSSDDPSEKEEASPIRPENPDAEAPAPAKLQRMTAPEALTRLERLASRKAQHYGLAIKRKNLLSATEHAGIQRARLDIEVSGSERALYQWIDRLHVPSEFRGVTGFRINPSKNDDTQVTCRITLEQWFLPESEGADFPEVKASDLAPLADIRHYPVELFLKITEAGPERTVRIRRAEIYNTFDEEGQLQRTIQLIGDAKNLVHVNEFERNLTKSDGLKGYRWTMPPPMESKVGSWLFMCAARVEAE